MIEKPLHGVNIAVAIGTAVTAVDMTLFGAAGLASGAALSALSIFKKMEEPTKDAAKLMEPVIEDALRRAVISADQKRVVLQLLQAYVPDVTDIAAGSNIAERVAANMRRRVEKREEDPARLNARVLATYQSVLAAALEPVVTPTDLQSANIAAILQRLDAGGEHRRMRDEGITEKAILRLARRIAQEATDLGTAWAALEDAVAVAVRVQQEGNAPSNHHDFVDEVLARTAELAAEGEYTAALDEIDTALEEDRARRARLLSRGIDVARLAGDAERAAGLLVQQLQLDTSEEQFEALQALQHAWYERGRDGGLAFEAAVAIHLAQRGVEQARTDDNQGAALVILGNALQSLGQRESSIVRIKQAVIAYQKALEKRTRERAPRDWALTQNNLGNALLALGERESCHARLEAAIAAYRNALLEYTRDRAPLHWAGTKNNLGNALTILGQRQRSTARLEEAIALCREALEEYTRHRAPLDWAAAQNNLGNGLVALGRQESGTARIEEGVTAYRNALLEFKRERVPLDWALTLNNLGNALRAIGERDSGTARLEEAIIVYLEALEERIRERMPLDWAKTQSNLASVEISLFDKTSTSGHLDAAEKYLAGSREVFVQAGATEYVAVTDQNAALIAARRD